MLSIHNFTLLLLLIILPGMVWAEDPKLPDEDLPHFIATAVANNPELKSSQSRWEMFANKAKQASALDDPMLMLKLQNMLVREPFVFDQDTQSAKVIGISQQIPFWGKRAIKQEVANFEAESYKWSIEERKLELTRMVKETFYKLWAVDKFLEIVEKNLLILADFVTIAESKYSVGQGVQQDIYKAGLEQSKLLDMQITLKQQRKSLEANFNYLLYRPGNTPVGHIADFTLPQLSLSAEQLNEIAFQQRPQIKTLLSLTNKGHALHRLAQKEFYPDFNLFFEYMLKDEIATNMVTDPGYDMFTVGVTVNLPLQQERRQAMLAESTSETGMAAAELNALKNSISYIINDSIAQLDRRMKLVELYKNGIIPQAEQSLESAVIGYRVSNVDFLTLLDSRITLFTYEREMYDSLAEYMMKLALLEAAVGIDLVSNTSDTMMPQLPVVPEQTPGQSPSPFAPASEHSQHR